MTEAARRHIAALHARWPDLSFAEPRGGIIAGAEHAVAEWTAQATQPETARRIEWDGIDLIQVRDGRICRNAAYSSAHRARVLDPA
jgi:hypothetical protein